MFLLTVFPHFLVIFLRVNIRVVLVSTRHGEEFLCVDGCCICCLCLENPFTEPQFSSVSCGQVFLGGLWLL